MKYMYMYDHKLCTTCSSDKRYFSGDVVLWQ